MNWKFESSTSETKHQNSRLTIIKWQLIRNLKAYKKNSNKKSPNPISKKSKDVAAEKQNLSVGFDRIRIQIDQTEPSKNEYQNCLSKAETLKTIIGIYLITDLLESEIWRAWVWISIKVILASVFDSTAEYEINNWTKTLWNLKRSERSMEKEVEKETKKRDRERVQESEIAFLRCERRKSPSPRPRPRAVIKLWRVAQVIYLTREYDTIVIKRFT